MAIEAVEITAGSGTKVGVDVVDTDKQIQYVKLMDGTDGSATVVAIGGGVEAAALRVTIASDSTGVLSVDDNGGALTVDGTVAVSAITAGDNNIGNVDVVTLPALVAGSAIIGNVRVDQTTPGTTNGVVVNSGTVTTVSTVTSVTAVAGMPTGASATAVQGTVAAGSAAAQNPVLNGAKAVAALPAVVDANDVTNLLTDLVGRLIVLPYANPENTLFGCTGVITNTDATNVIATDSGAGLKWYMTDLMVTNSDATVGTLVTITDDDAVTLWVGYAAALGGGFAVKFGTPIPTTANSHIHATCTTTSAEVSVCISAFKAP